MGHTKGKWVYQEESDAYTHIVRPAENLNAIICSCGQDSTGVSEANARRICQCVNSHDALLNFVLHRSGHNDDCDCLDNGSPRIDCTCGYDKARDEAIIYLTAAVPETKQQRDALLAALKEISDLEDTLHIGYDIAVDTLAKQAIAEAEK